MSLVPRAMPIRRPIKHLLTMVALAVFTIASQAVLPLISYSVAVRFDQAAWGKTETWDQFWVDRFRFYWLFKPALLEPKLLRFQSATACGDELVVLFATSKAKDPDECCPMLRCNLKTGVITQSHADPGIRHVLSDGQKIWWLPTYSNQMSPFIWEGRPVTLTRPKGAQWQLQMVEFVDGKWTNTEQFVIRPKSLALVFGPFLRLGTINGRLVAIRGDTIVQSHYCTDFEFGTEEQAARGAQGVANALMHLKRSLIAEAGWKKLTENAVGVIQTPRRSMLIAPQKSMRCHYSPGSSLNKNNCGL